MGEAINNSRVSTDILKRVIATKHEVPVEDVSIDEVQSSAGSKKGDGFCCEIIALDIKANLSGQPVEEHLVAKVAPDGPIADVLRQIKFFDQEGESYSWFIPTLQKLRSEKGLKPLSLPACYYSSVVDQLIILENVKAQGFQVVEKKVEPLSVNSIKLVLKELASFHASGYYYMKTYPGGIEQLSKDHPRLYDEVLTKQEIQEKIEIWKQWKQMNQGMVHSCVLVCQEYSDKELARRMEAFESKVSEIMDEMILGRDGIRLVLHGDAWYNNFMFKFADDDTDQPTDVSIFDLQMTRIGRLGVDLAYFFCSSVSFRQRKDHLDKLLHFYYDQFFKVLKDLGDDSAPGFTFEEMKKEFDTCFCYGVILGSLHAQALIVNEASKANIDIGALNDEGANQRMLNELEVEILVKAAASPGYRQAVISLAQDALERNII